MPWAQSSSQVCLALFPPLLSPKANSTTDLPATFPALRTRLFHLAHTLGNLPPSVRETLSRPETAYSFGWSHGKEVMNGRADTAKGSYYANPLLDKPVVSDAQRAAHPEYYAGNVWPSDIGGLEEFESAFKALGAFVASVGVALARACEEFGRYRFGGGGSDAR